MSFDIITTKDIEDVASSISSIVLDKLKENKKVLFFVAGGSAIKVVVKIAEIIKKYDYKGLTIMLTDERYGEIGHADSNWYQLIQNGFDLPETRLIPTLTGKERIETAREWEEVMKEQLDISDYRIGLFGIGSDGHTAGILPESEAIISEELVCTYLTPKFPRITMTFKAIEKLDEAFVFAQGEEKWKIFEHFKEDIDLAKQPAQILKRIPKLTIFTDYKVK